MNATPITDVTVIAGDYDVSSPAGFTRIDTDLNLGAGGDYVYACYRHEPGEAAIMGADFPIPPTIQIWKKKDAGRSISSHALR